MNFCLDKAPDHFHVKHRHKDDHKAHRCQIGRTNKWKIMANKVLDPNYSQLKDLIRALDKIEELNEHDEQVQIAFRIGKAPPLKFSDAEQEILNEYVEQL